MNLIVLTVKGTVLTYNPRLETGLVVPDLRGVRILLKKTRSPKEASSVPLKLSECYIDLSPGTNLFC